MATLELVIGDRVALVVGDKAHRGIVDFDQDRAPGAQWFIRLEAVEQGEPKEIQVHILKEPTAS